MRTGERTDYVAFVQMASPRLFRTAYALCGDYQLAEDVLQSALLRAYTSWWRVRRARQPEAYVRQIVINQIRSWWRTKAARPNLPLDEISRTNRREDHVECAEGHVVLADELWRALATLPPRQRAVIVLRYFEDLTELEIAKTLRIRPGTVKSQAHQALSKLRAALRTADLVDEKE